MSKLTLESFEELLKRYAIKGVLNKWNNGFIVLSKDLENHLHMKNNGDIIFSQRNLFKMYF
jgi:hypothetical protein